MRVEDLSIATMTWARNAEEESLLQASLRSLAALGAPVLVADGGSSEEFLDHLRGFPNTTVFRAEHPGVVGQTRASLGAALKLGTRFLLYTEPDKRHFFDVVLRAFVDDAPADERLGVSIASRTAESFATFPATQRCTEGTLNSLFGKEVGLNADFCYGPLLLNRALVPELDTLSESIGWGWRFYLIGAAERGGYRLHAFHADLPCPPNQRSDHAAERAHRMRQLGQNIEGILRFVEAS